METKNLTPLKKSVSVIVGKATSLAIKTKEDIKVASDILFQISKFARKVKKEKGEYVDPAKAIIAKAKTMYGPIEDQCAEAEQIIKSKMIDFNEKEEKKAAIKQEKIAQDLKDGKIDMEKASEKIENTAPEKSFSGEEGTVQFRDHKEVILEDATKLPRQYLSPNIVLIRADALKGIEIPGVKVKATKIVAKGGQKFKNFIDQTGGN